MELEAGVSAPAKKNMALMERIYCRRDTVATLETLYSLAKIFDN